LKLQENKNEAETHFDFEIANQFTLLIFRDWNECEFGISSEEITEIVNLLSVFWIDLRQLIKLKGITSTLKSNHEFVSIANSFFEILF